MKKGDMERAKILAENALREHQQSLSLLKLSARMEAVAQRIEQALVMGKVTKSMSKTVDGMEAAFASLDATKISKIMDRFAEQFDEVDLKTKVMGYVILNIDVLCFSKIDKTSQRRTGSEHGLSCKVF